MAVPSSGSVSLYGIAKEIHLDNYNNSIPNPNQSGTNWDTFSYPRPISLKNMSTGAGGFDAINSASSSKPNGSTPHGMGEFRGYDHDASDLTLITTISGQQHTASNRTPTNFLVSMNAFKGKTVRLLFHYVSGTGFKGDFQIDNIRFPYASGSSWYTSTLNFGSSSYSGTVYDYRVFPPTNLGQMQTTRTDTTSHTNATWYNITTGGTALRWNANTGGTPSSSTGITRMSGYHVYAETSGSGYSNKNFWMRSPEWDIDNVSGNFVLGFTYGAYGSNMGTLKFYVQEV